MSTPHGRQWSRRGLALAGLSALLACALMCLSRAIVQAAPSQTYRSPYAVAYSSDGKFLAVSERTGKALAILDAQSGKVLKEVALTGEATGVAWGPGDARVFVAEYTSGAVAEVDPGKGAVLRRFQVGHYPLGLAVAPKAKLLVVTNSGDHTVSVVDLDSGKEKGRVPVVRSPFAVAVTPDESLAVVSNLIASGDANMVETAAAVSLIDLAALKNVANVRLPPGATSCRGVAVSPEGHWAYAVHTMGRTTLPTTQLERGWVVTNCLTILDLKAKALFATVLLDRLSEGAADPWGVAVARDGKTLWVSLAGVHQLARIDLAGLHDLLAGKLEGHNTPRLSPIWTEISKDPKKRAELTYDLAALHGADLLTRPQLAGRGPRGLDISPDGKTLAAGLYFSDQVILADSTTCKVAATVPLGSAQELDPVRKGELYFHDGSYSFQHWLSCVTCHPDGRADGLNWDLLNDGLGNPKNSRSLVFAHRTPPMMTLAERDTMETAVMAGFRFIEFREPSADVVESVQAYLRSLTPERSPYLLPDGELSRPAQRGKAVFENVKTGCAACHPAPLFTDLKLHDVGTGGKYTHPPNLKVDTPTLVETWRTAPYLHDGRAVNMVEVLTKFNPGDKHGRTSHLTKEELDDLAEYILSL